MKRILVFSCGLGSYLIFLGTFLYLIAFVSIPVEIVPKTLDSEAQSSIARSLITDILLVGLFALQHSVMARKEFKQKWQQYIPKYLERSIYVLLASIALCILFWQWQPVGGIVWNLENITLKYIFYTLSATGWLIVLISTFLIDHFDLFGVRQVYLYLRQQEYRPLKFETKWLYKYVRHPLMLGFLIAFWFAPKMTISHFIFAVAMTIYIFVGIYLEERDLIAEHGENYRNYQNRVGAILPFFFAEGRRDNP
ncbi:MAG: methanethiol S-methyltransferase [Prochloraceae cyanobacterium]